MTDWDQISTDIQQAMTALHDADQASKSLLEQPDQERIQTFQEKMRALYLDLKKIQYVLDHEDIFFSDGVADALSNLFTGKPAPWHKA